jgi:glucose 1-dehydrogenase
MWHGIRVNVIEPGWVDTPGEHRWYTDADLERAGKAMPLGRLATPEDIGKAAVFLASEPAAYICGAVLPVQGGALLQGAVHSRTE